jgi:hypothetical protein
MAVIPSIVYARRYAKRADKELLECTAPQLERLMQARMGHTTGLHSSDPTIQTCRDADRFDIYLRDFDVDPHFLGTSGARSRHMISYVMSASRGELDRTLI